MSGIHVFLSSNQVALLFMSAIILSVLLIICLMKYRTMHGKYMKVKRMEEKSNDLLREILDSIPDPVFCKDADGIYTECNREFADAIGLKREDIIGRSVFQVDQEIEQAEIYHKADIDLMKSKGKQIYETKVKYADGSIQDVLFRKAALVSNEGEILGLVGVMINITESKRNEKKIQWMLKIKEAFIEINQSIIDFNNVNEFLNVILEEAMSIIDVADYGSILRLKEDGNLVIAAYKNYDLEKMKKFTIPLQQTFIWEAAEGNIKNAVIINDVCKLNCVAVDVAEEARNWRIKSTISTPIMINGRLYGLLSIDSNETNAFLPEHLRIMEYIKVQVEMAISKHMLYEDKIYSSRHDKLTGLYDRRYFEELCINMWKSHNKNEMSFYVVGFDINDLKSVNDNYGHSMGDEYVKAFAHELKEIANGSDIIARYGGDEFIGVFFNTDEESLRARIEAMLGDLSVNPVNKELNIFCSFSFGIAKFPDDHKELDGLIKMADKRMYECKREYKKLFRTEK